MMRSLEAGLGIPAKVLLKESDEFRDPGNISWSSFPVKEMEKRRYFGKSSKNSDLKDMMENFFALTGMRSSFIVMTRKSNYTRASRPMDKPALAAWSAYVFKESKKIEYPVAYTKGKVDLELMRKLAKLSVEPRGPVLAVKFLKDHGIGLVIERHFPKTYLDGAVILLDKKHPAIGLTLRYDRIDNFWFTLFHELAHIVLHYEQNINLFYDDLDKLDSNEMELQADKLAMDALIPEDKWENSPARIVPSPVAAESLAKELGIHVAIVAGRMRHEGSRYNYLNKIINEEGARKYFPREDWGK
jgi:HTH-type transcriptional regulator/antitoxin HigA